MRRAARVDGTHREVIDALRASGFAAVSTAVVGAGFPDLVCFHPCVGLRLVEVKSRGGETYGGARSARTRARQARFAGLFPTTVLRSAQEAQEWARREMDHGRC